MMEGTVETAGETRGDNRLVDVEIHVGGGGWDAESELEEWRKHCVYRVPPYVKDLHSKAYAPQVVSLGPYHHGEEHLKPMEVHKARACRGKPMESFMAAVGEVSQRLMDAYEQLDGGWREGPPEAFLHMLVVDGCFVLEIIRAYEGESCGRYHPDDPVFGSHAMVHSVPPIRRDMLLLENQLPLLLLETLAAVESPGNTQPQDITRRVHQFVAGPPGHCHPTARGLHPLDVYWESLVGGRLTTPTPPPPSTGREAWGADDGGDAWPATKLREAGVRFKRSSTNSLADVRFQDGALSLPATAVVGGLTEHVLLNLMAWERQHVGSAGSGDVTSYVFFMSCILRSGEDVELLRSKGILPRATGSAESVAEMFGRLAVGISSVRLDSHPCEALRQLARHRRRLLPSLRYTVVHEYLRAPGALFYLYVTVLALVLASLCLREIYLG